MAKFNRDLQFVFFVFEWVEYVLELALIFNNSNLDFEWDYIYD